MVKRFLEQKRAITEVLSKDKKTRSLVPTWQDVDVLEPIDAALSPLLEITDALSSPPLPTQTGPPLPTRLPLNCLSAQQAVERELGNYLLAPDADSDSDPLEWWEVYQKNFHRVSKLAKQYLRI
ncbi:hypothetical protein SRHO_G00146040 [Serrasalmus rhombeus]